MEGLTESQNGRFRSRDVWSEGWERKEKSWCASEEVSDPEGLKFFCIPK